MFVTERRHEKIINSLIIAISFISVIPVPQKFIPEWTPKNLRYFCLMLPVTGLIFGALWLLLFLVLSKFPSISQNLRGFVMMFCTLALTGGLHMDGFMDTCDAVFSHMDTQTRLKILSDTHAGSFAVMGCIIILMAKTFLYAELFSHDINFYALFFIPVYSRLGMGLLLNNLRFAKSGGLAVLLGASRNSRDNIFFAMIFIILSAFCAGLNAVIIPVIFIICVMAWKNFSIKIFTGITGDLLGAFVEISEVFMLLGQVVIFCI